VFTKVAGESMVARLRPDVRPLPGSTIELRIDMARAHLFDAESGLVWGATTHGS
jgi:hypothetical protein